MAAPTGSVSSYNNNVQRFLQQIIDALSFIWKDYTLHIVHSEPASFSNSGDGAEGCRHLIYKGSSFSVLIHMINDVQLQSLYPNSYLGYLFSVVVSRESSAVTHKFRLISHKE